MEIHYDKEIHFNTTFFRALCEKCNTTVPKVSAELGINPQTLRRFINGERTPSIGTLVKLGEYFDVDFSLFIVLGEPLEVLTYEEQEAILNSKHVSASGKFTGMVRRLKQAQKKYEFLEKEMEQKKREQFALKMFLLNEKERLQEWKLVSQYMEASDKELYDFIMSVEE